MDLTPQESLKRKAAKQALEYVESGMVLGLGTGSTVAHFLDVLAAKLSQGGTLRYRRRAHVCLD